MSYKKTCFFFAILLVSLASLTAVAHSQDKFERARKAFKISNFEESFRLYKELAETGDANAQFFLARHYTGGYIIKKNIPEFRRLMKLSAAAGHQSAQLVQANKYFYGHAVPVDVEKAADWYEKAADQGDPPNDDDDEFFNKMMYGFTSSIWKRLSFLDRRKPATGYYSKFWNLYKKASSENDAESQYQIGNLWNGSRESMKYGNKWFLRASSNGHLKAQVELGRNLLFISKDKKRGKEGLKFLQIAASRGSSEAKSLLNDYKVEEATKLQREQAILGLIGVAAMIFANMPDTPPAKSDFAQEQLDSTWAHVGAALILP